MAALFLAGPLACPSILKLVSGERAAPDMVPARLQNCRAVGAPGQCFGIWLELDEAALEGQLIDVDGQTLDRIDFLARTIGLTARNVQIETDASRRDARVYSSASDAPEDAFAWQGETWIRDWGDTAGAAGAEILSCMGREAAGSIAPRLPMILARAFARTAAQDAAPATLRSQMRHADVTESDRTTRHAGFFVTNEYQLRHPQYDGSTSAEVTREVFICTDASIVLPYDPVRDRVCLIEQFRMGPYGRGDPLPWVLEPVAGRIDAGETPETTAYRECLEEAGLVLRGLEHINSHYCSPGSVTEFFHCFVGLCELPETNSGRGGLAAEHEDIKTHVLSFDDALALCATGEINVGPLVLMLYWLERERPRLRAAA